MINQSTQLQWVNFWKLESLWTKLTVHCLLECGGYSLSHSTHLHQRIPSILHQELYHLRQMISGKQISITFDGTTHIAEAVVVVVHFVDDDWIISQKVVEIFLDYNSSELKDLLLAFKAAPLFFSSSSESNQNQWTLKYLKILSSMPWKKNFHHTYQLKKMFCLDTDNYQMVEESWGWITSPG